MSKSKWVITWLLGFLLGAIIACNGTGNSAISTAGTSPPPTTGGIPLYAIIMAPNAKPVTARIVSTRLVNGGGETTSQTVTCTGIGTLSGYPNDADPITASVYAGTSCTGYLFDIGAAPIASDYGVIQKFQSPAAVVFFDAPNCTGNAYVFPGYYYNGVQGIGEIAFSQGFVVRVDPSNSDPLGANPATYFYVPAGAAETPFNAMSMYVNGGCSANSQTLTGVKLLVNDPTITGINSAPVQGPITIGTNQ